MIAALVIICIFVLALVGLVLYFSIKFEDKGIFREPEPKKENIFENIFPDEMMLVDSFILDKYFEGCFHRKTIYFKNCFYDVYSYVSALKYADDEDGLVKESRVTMLENLLTVELAKEYTKRFSNAFDGRVDFMKLLKVDMKRVKGRILVKKMYI